MLDELKMDLGKEFEWLRSKGKELEKNYQIWRHRRCVAEILDKGLDLVQEMEFLAEIFDSDAKNYHAWTYRIWLVERF